MHSSVWTKVTVAASHVPISVHLMIPLTIEFSGNKSIRVVVLEALDRYLCTRRCGLENFSAVMWGDFNNR